MKTYSSLPLKEKTFFKGQPDENRTSTKPAPMMRSTNLSRPCLDSVSTPGNAPDSLNGRKTEKPKNRKASSNPSVRVPNLVASCRMHLSLFCPRQISNH